jgi:SAM-dependent methyltransferase
MSELSGSRPTERFTGLADVYAKYRPDYPEAALDFILSRCGLGSRSLLIDVGSGTGISTRLFARRGLRVLGIEPNAPMRARAEAEPLPAGIPVPSYQDGRAEATGLPSGQADAVLAAQAFHWFQVEEALREFYRILRPGGWVILLSNERDESDPFTAAYGAVFRTVPETAAIEGPRARVGEPLLASPLFTAAERLLFGHQQTVDRDGLLGRAFSASYAPREPARAEAFAAALREVFDQFQQAGQVVLHYQTAVYVARRRGPD